MESFNPLVSGLCASASLRLCVKLFRLHRSFKPVFLSLLASLACLTALAADAIPQIPRVLPPEGLEIPAEVRSRLEMRLAMTKKRLEGVRDETLKPDVEIFTKAVELALLHHEF